MIRRFTGRHMALMLIGFFGVVVLVNAVMATIAERSFGGTVVENSYVASQRFNGWLAAARRQERAGWSLSVKSREGTVLLALTRNGAPREGAIAAMVNHPLGGVPERPLHFRPIGGGRFVSRERLPAGRWQLHASIRSAGEQAHFLQDFTA